MIQIQSSLFFLIPLLLLVFPLDWIGAVIIASGVHEVMHILTVYALNGKILRIRILAGGCVIESDFMSEWKQFLSILAGPLGSLLLLLLCHSIPKVAICGLFQGLYNLIPILPLDGGRLLQIWMNRFFPDQTDCAMRFAAISYLTAVCFLVLYINIRVSFEPWLMVLGIGLAIRLLSRKIPCKQSEIRVQ